ncbi:MAG: hypothetical protein ACYDA9_18530 [Terriglobia bacterium]
MALDHINYSVDQESQEVLFVLRLMPNAERARMKRALDPMAAGLHHFGAEQSARILAGVQVRTSHLGIREPVWPVAALDPQNEAGRAKDHRGSQAIWYVASR